LAEWAGNLRSAARSLQQTNRKNLPPTCYLSPLPCIETPAPIVPNRPPRRPGRCHLRRHVVRRPSGPAPRDGRGVAQPYRVEPGPHLSPKIGVQIRPSRGRRCFTRLLGPPHLDDIKRPVHLVCGSAPRRSEVPRRSTCGTTSRKAPPPGVRPASPSRRGGRRPTDGDTSRLTSQGRLEGPGRVHGRSGSRRRCQSVSRPAPC